MTSGQSHHMPDESWVVIKLRLRCLILSGGTTSVQNLCSRSCAFLTRQSLQAIIWIDSVAACMSWQVATEA